MKLYYRGQSYEYDSNQLASRKAQQPFEPVRQSGAAYNLMYRGVTYRVDPNAKAAKVSLSPIVYKLIYRGIAYIVSRTAQEKVTSVLCPKLPGDSYS